MELNGNSVVDTVIEYASVKFGIELPVDNVSEQLRHLTFSQTMDLIDAIKKEEDDKFSDIIDMSSVNESGGTISPTAATISAGNAQSSKADVANRRAQISAQDQQRDATGATRTTAGGLKRPTGGPQGHGPSMTDPDDMQRSQNAQTAGTALDQATANAGEIERLKRAAGL